MINSDPPSDGSSTRVWVVSELYYPEETSTGYYLTGIAEGLARRRTVRVLCGQPTYGARGTRAATRERRHGVSIRRCWGTTFSKDSLAGRLLNQVTLGFSMFVRALMGFRSGDQVLVVTTPAVFPFLVALACALRGARCSLLIHDVYPDAIVAAGILSPGSIPVRILRRWTCGLLRRMDRIIVLGRDMEKLVSAMAGSASSRIRIIPNWADVDDILPEGKAENALLRSLNLSGRFVAQYSGNMGRTHDMDGLIEAARQLASHPDIHFLFIGSGARRGVVDQAGLRNVTLLSTRPRQELRTSLNACDVAILSMVTGMAGISVPSRMYNILAAGKPIIAAVDEESEVARIIREDNVGWIVPPGRADKLAEALLLARSRPDLLSEMAGRARQAAERYSRSRILDSYAALFDGTQTPAMKPEPSPGSRTILLLSNEGTYFLSHRLPVALEAQKRGFSVSVATHVKDEGDQIRAAGFVLFPLRLRRGQRPVLEELRALWELVTLYRRRNPDLVHHVTLKHAVFGTIAARIAGVPRVVNALTGLGFVFIQEGWVSSFVRFLLRAVLRRVFPWKRCSVIIQNRDDLKLLVDTGVINRRQAVLIRGSGVDLQAYASHPEPEGPVTMILASRMLWDKGVGEFVEAARLLRDQDRVTRFILVGAPDPSNPNSVNEAQLTTWQKEGIVEWWGHRADMPQVFAHASVVVLPSYREGLPKVLLEAAACGRPLIATDVPGCREIVRDGDNGFLVPLRDSRTLAAAMGKMRDDPDLRRAMGARSRAIVEAEFSQARVAAETANVYEHLMQG